MTVGVFVLVLYVAMTVFVLVGVFGRDTHIELRPRNRSPLLPRNMQMIFAQSQLLQFVLEVVRVHTEVKHCANEHVAADTAEDIQIKSFHFL